MDPQANLSVGLGINLRDVERSIADALVASDGVIIPVQTQYYALKGFTALMNVITQIRTKGLNPKLRVYGLLATFYDGRTILGRDMLQEMRDLGDHHIFENMIRQTVRL